ncbi:MAG: thioredoxin family protein [Pontiellaceae bacterium]|nr:thioredoxin family protein [Pontiellaceae bacterium]MBN2784567.1 thioredoxin family protein [Pontiellaceae bacterium]
MYKWMAVLMVCIGVAGCAEVQDTKIEMDNSAGVLPADRVAVWTGDVEQARAEAAKYGMPILLLYTAPGWCGYCRDLDEQLITQEVFQRYANENLVLLQIDFSDHEKGDAWEAEHTELVADCPIDGFPHLYLLSSAAEKLGSVQYYEPEWSIQDYLDRIAALKNAPAE